MKRLHVFLIVFVFVIIIAAIIGGMLVLTDVDTTTHGIDNAGWIGEGRFPGLGGTTTGSGRELMDDDEYILSWSPDLIGQKITVQGRARDSNGVGISCILEGFAEYRLSIAGAEVARLPAGLAGGVEFGQASYEVRQYELRGRTAEGVLRAEFWGKCVLGDWIPLAYDQTRLLSGIGSITRNRDQVSIGETASFSWRIPYTTDDATGTGWAIDIFSTAQARTVIGPTKLTQLTGSISYTATASDFSNRTACRNELIATLRNELWDKAYDTTTVIDISGLGPSVEITGFSPARPEQGDTVKVIWEASENPQTHLPLTKIVILYGYGGADVQKELPADTREFSFTAGSQGNVRFTVIAYDTGCRPSPTASVDIQIGEPAPAGLDLFLILFGLLFLILAIVAWRMAGSKGNWPVFLILLAIFAVVSLVAALLINDALRGLV